MSAHTEKSICLVSDNLERSRRIMDLLGWRFPVNSVNLQTGDTVGNDVPGLCIFDADLSDRDNIPRIKQITRSLVSCEKHFVVDENKRANIVQANALGAHGLLRQGKLQGDAIKLLRTYRNQMMKGIWQKVSARAREALTGMCTLNDNLYDAVSCKGPLPKEQVIRSCDQVITCLREESLSSWLDAVRQHHSYTYRHSMIVSALTTSFCIALGMGQSDVERMTLGALMHDLGKMKLPLGLLDKPGALTAPERAVINKHPEYGAEILRKDGQFSDEVIEIALRHHELLDGSGYPDGLAGDQISDPVRIMTVVDIFSALIDKRSYKEAMANDKAYEILIGMGEKLDQDIVGAFKQTAEYAIAATDKVLNDAVPA